MAAVANAGNLKEPLNPGDPDDMPPKTKCQKFQRGTLKYGGGCAGIIFLLTWLVQGCMYWGATLGCSPGSVGEGTKYQSGEPSAFGDGNANMVPLVSELVARSELSWFGVPYDLKKISNAGMGHGASDGTWSRYWGPIFDSFSYQDITAGSKTTMYMRRNLLKLGMSHRMGRCDDKAPFIDISEGMNYFTNRWHTMMKMQTGIVLKIYADGKEMAWAKEMSHGSERSITFQAPNSDGEKYGDATIRHESAGGFENRWTINMKKESLMPSWVATGAVMLFATQMEGEIAVQDAEIAEHKSKGNTNMLAALPVVDVDKAGDMTIPKIFLAAALPDPIPAAGEVGAHEQIQVLASTTKTKLRLGQDTNYPPYAFSEDGKPAGFGHDVAIGMNQMCPDLDIEVVITQWANCWTPNGLGEGLENGTLDACMTYTHTKGIRNEFADFSHGILEVNKAAGLLTMLDDNGAPKVTGHDDLKGKKVVDVAGWAPTADGLDFVKNKCTGENYDGGYELLVADGADNNNELALSWLYEGTADAMFVYADQAYNYKKVCKTGGEDLDCDKWKEFGQKFAYVQTGQFGYVHNGTTLGLAKKGSGVIELLNPCLEKFMKTKEYFEVCEKFDMLDTCYRNEFFPPKGDVHIKDYNKPTEEHDKNDCSSGYCPCTGGASDFDAAF